MKFLSMAAYIFLSLKAVHNLRTLLQDDNDEQFCRTVLLIYYCKTNRRVPFNSLSESDCPVQLGGLHIV